MVAEGRIQMESCFPLCCPQFLKEACANKSFLKEACANKSVKCNNSKLLGLSILDFFNGKKIMFLLQFVWFLCRAY